MPRKVSSVGVNNDKKKLEKYLGLHYELAHYVRH
jgi:hypothetical protein